jgi:hypothetical protein
VSSAENAIPEEAVAEAPAHPHQADRLGPTRPAGVFPARGVQPLVQAGLARLRAVPVPVLATVGGLVPLAIFGGELWRPLTAVHICGLLLATVLTLVMLPVFYYVFCARLKWIP